MVFKVIKNNIRGEINTGALAPSSRVRAGQPLSWPS